MIDEVDTLKWKTIILAILTAKGEYASSKISGHFDSFECPTNFLDLSVTIRDRMKKTIIILKDFCRIFAIRL